MTTKEYLQNVRDMRFRIDDKGQYKNMASFKIWKNKIKQACVDAGTYKPYFDSVIDTLAMILEKRDQAEKLLEHNMHLFNPQRYRTDLSIP